jgi:hypothetical protein
VTTTVDLISYSHSLWKLLSLSLLCDFFLTLKHLAFVGRPNCDLSVLLELLLLSSCLVAQPLSANALIVGQAFGQHGPGKFRQVLDRPHVVAVETSLFLDHLVSIEDLGSGLRLGLGLKLDPPLGEAGSFVASLYDSVLLC